MAAGLDRVVSRAQGEIIEKDVRSYGVVLLVAKKRYPHAENIP